MGNLLKYHIQQGVQAAIYEMRGMNSELPRLRAQAKLRIATLDNNELYRLADMLSPNKTNIDLKYQQLVQQRDLIIRTANDWIDDLSLHSDQFFRSN